MKEDKILELLTSLAENKTTVDDVFAKLKTLPFKDVGFAKLDSHRSIRNGCGEVVFGRSKTYRQIEVIVADMIKRGEDVLVTHIDKEKADKLKNIYKEASYNETASTFTYLQSKLENKGMVSVVTAGTSDLPVAEEAKETLNFMGVEAKIFADVGVAGVHRLLSCIEEIEKADVVIVAAGMDGALPSVVGGLVSKPVIAVPTSCGYGVAFSGVAPLLTMLNSCASGVTVVNIDNGFGAAYSAALIAKAVK